MNKLIAIITISLILGGCRDRIITKSYSKSGKICYYIKSIEASKDNSLVQYNATSRTNYIYWQNSFNFLDSIGRYNVGDAITAEFIKL